MALRPGRNHVDSEIGFFMTTTAERGGFVSVSTLGSGEALDNASAVVEYAAAPSGKLPLGVLMNDVVNLDLTRQKQNVHKDERQVNTKVTLWTKGWVDTNMIVPGVTVANGDKAYLGPSGLVTNVNSGAVASPQVGVFLSKKDVDGFARVSFNLP